MTNQEVIEILLNEQKCLDRNDGIQCDRKCESCDLVMDVETIREAYSMAISALQAQDVPDMTVGDMTGRRFVELLAEYRDPELCAYKEYKGKPYFSIKYTENGEEYIGYSTYSPKVLSQYLREYFMVPVQPEQTRTQMSLANCISKRAAIDAVEKESQVDGAYGYMDTKSIVDLLNDLPSEQPEWNNHTVACLLAELFNDTCACNFNGIDEWLPEKCELLDSCPNPVGVACWEQYLKHRAERRTDNANVIT